MAAYLKRKHKCSVVITLTWYWPHFELTSYSSSSWRWSTLSKFAWKTKRWVVEGL